MSFDPKSHARAVVLATTMNSVVPAPSLFELQIRVPAIYAVAPKYAPPFDPLIVARLSAAARDAADPRALPPRQTDRCATRSRHSEHRWLTGRSASTPTPSRRR